MIYETGILSDVILGIFSIGEMYCVRNHSTNLPNLSLAIIIFSSDICMCVILLECLISTDKKNQNDGGKKTMGIYYPTEILRPRKHALMLN
jgi:hypothetical protein